MQMEEPIFVSILINQYEDPKRTGHETNGYHEWQHVCYLEITYWNSDDNNLHM